MSEAVFQESSPGAVVRTTSRGTLIARHPTMRDALDVLDRVAGSTCTVLVTGESGTGKELAIAALHDRSPRRDAPLVAVNCGAIPENLVESELFGHAKGAFTGATSARHGFVAAAAGGTLFLDEVGELPPLAQVKLLRLLQTKEYTPVGETKPVKCDVRIVAATNRDLPAEVAKGTFREDLFYRLNVIHVHLPPLRERPGDVELLARHFLKCCAERTGRTDVVAFSPEALGRIAADPWHGNVRSLENAIERAVLLSPGEVIPADCIRLHSASHVTPVYEPAPARVPASNAAIIDLRAAVEEYENTLIKSALERTGFNKSRAAQLLGLQRTTLVEMLKRKNIVAELPRLPRAA